MPNTTRWLETNVGEQKQTGYAAVTVTVDQGNLTGDQMRGVARTRARPPATAWCASRSIRTWCWRSFRWRGCRRCTRRCDELGLGERRRAARSTT